MRRLLLLRHAKAAPLADGDDFDRELTERGRDDARKIGAWIASSGWQPDYAIYSGSERTRQTFDIVSGALNGPLSAFEQNALYDATRALILGLLRELPAKAQACLVVGHNPGMGDVANLLAGAGDEVGRLQLASKYPTGALAILAFDDLDWSGLTPRTGRLERFVTPADL
jgi:phosphohistidine phosphatase